MIGFFAAGEIMLMLYCMDFLKKKLFNQVVRGKSMYISSKKINFFCSSIAGGIIPIALGTALNRKK